MPVTCCIFASVFQLTLSLNYKGIKGKVVHLQDVRIGVSDAKWISLSIANLRY